MTTKITLTAASIVTGLLVSACDMAPTAQPLRLSGPVGARFAQDEAECRSIAMRYDQNLASEGAVAGALIGAAIGAGESHEDALAGAAIGGLIGAAEGTVDKEESQRNMVIRCMQNRGHPVIG
ncbi:glycine zipper domain-containing protein [Phaeobacter sp. QD34_3]|uniref:glycine zipper domain-containing protein n=1 Tax=unclassified Phaeobacter TaxID=2621772 RepID=UPI00237F2843|nr:MULTISPECIES: glycine zipper domain-containing protein [unclassified Phaeobacter]MDE4132081.1 glycine zipper domain-containing protein [Phaeobacter sp. QD34_3]MDE4135719.1 glycine zipper domain-containing protein [Phaeobacter sp. QD34_24]MDE4172666.1 glycine zipper domain-containing protein [Phaeobacter sp. PT47_59]